ncbi:MAG: 30S ribosomal protein S7 [bacterium]|nr:30S ribosomal protein S7 [bacterium]
MRGGAPKRRVTHPDSVYHSELVARMINRVMWNGKKGTAEKIVYGALDRLIKKTGEGNAVRAFEKALDNVRPNLEIRSKRVGGSTYQVPVEVRPEKQEAMAMRWLINYARQRKGKPMADKLGQELIDAFNNTGSAVKKKEDTHKMAEANRAYAHYRF